MSDFDLYEFPPDWTGRKTYVSVIGHRRSIPYIYAFKGYDGHYHVRGDELDDIKVPTYMPDIGEYVSVVDGTHITSRSAHREHLKRHDLIEVGNERVPYRERAMPPIGPDIKRAIEQLRG